MAGASRDLSPRLAGVAVALVVLVAAALLARSAKEVGDWIVMTDELLYVRLALGIGDSGSPVPTIHGEYFGSLNQLWPLLISPVYALLDTPDAFRVAHVVGGLAFSSAAVPAYLLARRVTGLRWMGVLAGALTVAVPWAATSMMLLTENAAYPAFVWAVLAIHLAVAEPAPRRDVLALAGIVLATLARTQLVVLLAVLPAAIVVHEAGSALAHPGGRPRGAALRETLRGALAAHRLLAAVLAAGAVVAAALLLARGTDTLLGNYAVTAEGDLLPPGLLEAAGGHVAWLGVGLAVLPVVVGLGWILSALAGRTSRHEHAFASVALVVLVALPLVVASVTQRFAPGIHDRYVFYLAPVLLVAMCAGLVTERRPVVGVLVAAAVFAWLTSLTEYGPSAGPYFDTPASALHQVLSGQSERLGDAVGIDALAAGDAILVATVLAGIACAVAFRLPRRLAVAAGAALAVLVVGIAQTDYVVGKALYANGGRSVGGAKPEVTDWVDRAVGEDARVGALPTYVNTAADGYVVQKLWWGSEFWNKSVREAYTFRGTTTHTPFPARELRVDPRTGRLAGLADADLLLLSASNVLLRPVGEQVRRDPDGHLDLVRLAEPARAAWVTTGVGDDGWVAERDATVRVFPAGGRARAVEVRLTLAAPAEIRGAVRYRVAGGATAPVAGQIARGERREVRVVACAGAPSPVDLRLAAGPRRTLPDGRPVRARLLAVSTRPAGPAGCR